MLSLRAITYVTGAIAFWSTNGVVAKYALMGLSVERVQFLQFTSAALALIVIQWLSSQTVRLKTAIPLDALILGLIGLTGTMVFQYLAFAYAPITQANIIAYAWPLFVALWVIVLNQTSISPFVLILPAVTGFVGVSFVIGQELHFSFRDTHFLGYIFAVCSALCMAVYTVGIAKTKVSNATLLLPATLAGVILTTVWCMFVGPQPLPEFHYIILGLYLGAGPIACGYFLWSCAVQADNAGRIAVFGYLTPVFSTGLLVISGEILTPLALLGAVLVFSSCFILGLQKS